MPRLTEQEQQDILRYIEADKPLPEKYRFLLFDGKREVELVWNGKTHEVCNLVLPFQVIEHVDEPRAEKPGDTALQQSLFDTRGRQLKGWTNKLIWGDNKLILSSLKNGPLRHEIEGQGGLKLIYIDPPFDVGADFSMDIEIGEDTFKKRPSILEEIAYRDTWGKGADSFIAMIYERLVLMRDLLAEDGSIYVHCDWRVSAFIRLLLDEVFGSNGFQAEIIYKRRHGHSDASTLGTIHDTIFFFSRSDRYRWNPQYTPYSEDYIQTYYRYTDPDGRRWLSRSTTAPGGRGPVYEWNGVKRAWRYTQREMQRLHDAGRLFYTENGMPRYKQYLDEMEGVPLSSLWSDVKFIDSWSEEDLKYPTQKPISLLERIIRASSNEGDLVADFFCGSGTTAAVAERLGRNWIVSDLGKFAIHTTRKRMIGVQRELKASGGNYRAFEILNLGKYERQHYIGVNPSLREAEQRKQIEKKEAAFTDLILHAYRAEPVTGFATFHGKRAGRLVAVGPVNLPVTRLFVQEVIDECLTKRITKADVLGFEFEMGLFPNVLQEARSKGVDIAAKYIPADVFDKRAVEKNQVVFHDVSFIEVKPHVKKSTVAVELTDFSVFYSQDSVAAVEAILKDKSSKVVVERGQIVKVSKDAKGVVRRELLTKKWTDWIDYWAVDFNFESKREIVRVANEKTGEWEERWTGEYIFENEWQSFRTRKNRALELTSVFQEVATGRRKIAVKVVDIFGTDTMTILEVTVGGKR